MFEEQSPEQIAADIVNRFVWTTNVMSKKGALVSMQVVVAEHIAEAIDKERAQYKSVLDSYAAENQRFSDEIDQLKMILTNHRLQGCDVRASMS